MKIMNTVFTDHLGVETRSSFQSRCHAIETLAMQPRHAAEEPNSVGAPRGATTPTQVYPVYPPSLITRVTSQPLQELDACSDGVAIPGQPELVNVGASNSVSILMHAQTVPPSPVSWSWWMSVHQTMVVTLERMLDGVVIFGECRCVRRMLDGVTIFW